MSKNACLCILAKQTEAMTGKILIVDDFRTNILYLNHLLSLQGHEVMSAVHVDAALELIETNAFDLFLLDVEMPVNNGFELCRRIRQSANNSDTPVIFITSKDDQQSTLSGFDAGGQDYITRPFSDRELLARVNTHLELKMQRETLYNLTKDLEKLVSVRTKELHTLLEKLKVSNHELTQAKRELESLDSAKEQFLQIINHEIRTPLNGILGFQLLLKDVILDEKYAEYLHMMNQSVKRLEKFSLQALLITQLRTGNDFGNSQTVWIDTEFHKTVMEFKDELHGKQIHVRSHIGPASIRMDMTLLRPLLSNLIENAMYYCKQEGQIEVTGRSAFNNRYLINVRHTGHEFPESLLTNPLTLFSEKEFVDGCPHLYLYTIQLIVNRISGKITLRNHSGKGAEVEIDLFSKMGEDHVTPSLSDRHTWVS